MPEIDVADVAIRILQVLSHIGAGDNRPKKTCFRGSQHAQCLTGLLGSASVTASATSKTLWVDFGGSDRLTVFGIGKLTADHVIF